MNETNQLNLEDTFKMVTLGQEATEYVAPTTKNITDLKVVSTSFELLDGEGIDKDKQEFKYKYFIFEDEEYRVPNPVLGNLKAILEKKPDLKEFSVSKTGTGLETRYTVIPL